MHAYMPHCRLHAAVYTEVGREAHMGPQTFAARVHAYMIHFESAWLPIRNITFAACVHAYMIQSKSACLHDTL
jgi:hypothetical protein